MNILGKRSLGVSRSLLLLAGVLAGTCAGTAGAQNVQFTPVVTTVAGTGIGGNSGNGAAATSAQLSTAVDAATTDAFGNIFISDTGNNVIRRVDAVTGIITVVAGGATSSTLCASPVVSSNPNNDALGDGCPATQAILNAPKAVRFYKGDMYIADSGDNLVRVVSAATGVIAPYAGNGMATTITAGKPLAVATSTPVKSPQDILFDSTGNLYIIVAAGNPAVLVVNASTKITSIVAGNYTAGKSGDGGQATSATLAAPFGLALDSLGDLFIAEGNNNDIRKVVLATGVITTYAGSAGTTPGYTGTGGPSNLALLNSPQHISVDAANNLYIADRANNRIVEVAAPVAPAAYGILNTIAGSGLSPTGTGDGGPALNATLNGPLDVELTAAGDLLITDAGDNKIRAVRPTGSFANAVLGTPVTQTVYARVVQPITVGSFGVPAGYPDFSAAPSPNCAPGTAVAAGTTCTVAVTFNPTLAGLRRAPLVFTDSNGNAYSESLLGVGLAPAAALLPGAIATSAGTGTAGSAGNNGVPTAALLSAPGAVAVDGRGNTFIADTTNNQVREIVAASGTIVAFAGTGAAGSTGDGGQAAQATLNAPAGIALDGGGNLYIADTGNHRIRLVAAATGLISTYAGTGTAGYAGDGGLAPAAQLNAPAAVAVAPGGLLLIADTGNNVLRAVGLRSGAISTFAGTGTAAYSVDPGPAAVAQFAAPAGIAVDNSNVVYVADTGNNRVRSIANNVVSTLAGTATAGFNGDGTAASTNLSAPTGISADAAQNVYVADTGNNRIRRIAAGQVVTVAGSASPGYTGNGGSSTAATLNAPRGVTLDGRGNLLLADTGNNAVRTVNTAAGALAFPTTSPGTTSAPLAILLNNIGNQPLALAAVTFPTPFLDSPSGTAPDCNGTAVTVAAGSFCQLAIAFSPAVAGNYSGNVSVADNSQAAPAAAQTISVSGVSAFTFTASATLPKSSVAGVNAAFVLSVANPNAVYGGTVHFTSSDPQAVLPANYTYLPSDNGSHTFQVQLRTTGIQTVTATDVTSPSISATASTTLVAGAAAKLVLVSGSGQTAKILTAFASSLTVEAFDAFGNPAVGTSVTFTAATTGASGTFAGAATATVATALAGTASSPQLTANAFAGSFTVQATATGVATPVAFSLSNTSVAVPGFSITSNPTTLTVAPGGSGTIPILVQGSGGLSAAIAFTCTTPVANLSCTFAPASVTPNALGAAVSTTLTVQSVGNSSQLVAHPGFFFAALFPLGLFALTRRRVLRGVLLLVCLGVALGAVSGCGSSSSSIVPGSYSVQVTGTSGAVSNSTTVLVYVTGYPNGV